MGIPPFKNCCGCCCKLEMGAPIGVGVYALLHFILIVLGAWGTSRMPSPDFNKGAAKAFCTETTPEYRLGYNECYGSDICDKTDWDSASSSSIAPDAINTAGMVCALLALGYCMVATMMKREQGPMAVHHSWKPLLFFPFWFFLGAIVNAALASEGFAMGLITWPFPKLP